MLKPSLNLKLGVPLLLITFVVSGLLLYGGAQLVKEEEVTTGAAADGGGAGPIAAGPVSVTIVAENILFDLKTLTANAGAEFNVTLDNRDAGVLHNIAFYTDRSAGQPIYVSELIAGPAVQENTFTAPATPGTYFFRCDVHPDTMNGAFIVQ